MCYLQIIKYELRKLFIKLEIDYEELLKTRLADNKNVATTRISSIETTQASTSSTAAAAASIGPDISMLVEMFPELDKEFLRVGT